MPPFSRQRLVANLCPMANLSGNALLPYDTTHKAKNSFNTFYNNYLDGENLSPDLRQTFVASAANLPDKAHEPRSQRRYCQRMAAISGTSGGLRALLLRRFHRGGDSSCTNHRRMYTWSAWTTFVSDVRHWNSR
jgi:hypothetical protein